MRDWNVTDDAGDTIVAGQTRSAAGLTFATIYGAGHMVNVSYLARYFKEVLMSLVRSIGPT